MIAVRQQCWLEEGVLLTANSVLIEANRPSSSAPSPRPARRSIAAEGTGSASNLTAEDPAPVVPVADLASGSPILCLLTGDGLSSSSCDAYMSALSRN